jgi:hypothetical protein
MYWSSAAWGAAAGAAGTTALNALTYLDMAVRGRPASQTPEQTVDKVSEMVHVPVPGEEDTRANRLAGLGPLTGIVAGIGPGVLLALARTAGFKPGLVADMALGSALAMVGSNVPMTVLGITDPRQWSLDSWLTDVVPHLAYGAVTAAALRRLLP